MEMLVEYVLPVPSFIMLYPLSFSQRIVGYVDPGTGSLVIQLVIGALAGGLVAAKVFWGRIRTWLRNSFSHSHASDESRHVGD